MPLRWPLGCSTGTPEAESVEEDILPPLEAQAAVAVYGVSALTDFDLFLEQELVGVVTVPEVKHRHFSLAALKREALRKRRAASQMYQCPTAVEHQRLMTMDRPNLDESMCPF